MLGGAIYGSLEMLWRGFTHWSMVFAGGVCFLTIHLINHSKRGYGLLAKCLLGSIVITAVEFSVGVVVNLILHLDVWDYSAMRGNILGQVCPQFALVWFGITVPACWISQKIRTFFDYLKRRETRAA